MFEGDKTDVRNTFAVSSRIWLNNPEAGGVHGGVRTPAIEFLHFPRARRTVWEDFPIFGWFTDKAKNSATLIPESSKTFPFGADSMCKPFRPPRPPTDAPLQVSFAYELTTQTDDDPDPSSKTRTYATVYYDSIVRDIIDLDKVIHQYYKVKKDEIDWSAISPGLLPSAFDLLLFRTNPTKVFATTDTYENHMMAVTPASGDGGKEAYAILSFYPEQVFRDSKINFLPPRLDLRRFLQLVRQRNLDLNPNQVDCTPLAPPVIRVFDEAHARANGLIREYNGGSDNTPTTGTALKGDPIKRLSACGLLSDDDKSEPGAKGYTKNTDDRGPTGESDDPSKPDDEERRVSRPGKPSRPSPGTAHGARKSGKTAGGSRAEARKPSKPGRSGQPSRGASDRADGNDDDEDKAQDKDREHGDKHGLHGSASTGRKAKKQRSVKTIPSINIISDEEKDESEPPHRTRKRAAPPEEQTTRLQRPAKEARNFVKPTSLAELMATLTHAIPLVQEALELEKKKSAQIGGPSGKAHHASASRPPTGRTAGKFSSNTKGKAKPKAPRKEESHDDDHDDDDHENWPDGSE